MFSQSNFFQIMSPPYVPTLQYLQSWVSQCLENAKDKLRLGLCNNDQKPRNQKLKFEYYNPVLKNSTETPQITASTIFQWHRNFSIHDVLFSPLPSIIGHPETVDMSVFQLNIEFTLSDHVILKVHRTAGKLTKDGQDRL